MDSSLSMGCHQLIRQGAGILISPEKLLEELGISCGNLQEKKTEAKKMLESLENMVYSSVVLYPRNIGQIMDESGLSAQEVLETLVSLEIKGYIKEISKNYYIRV